MAAKKPFSFNPDLLPQCRSRCDLTSIETQAFEDYFTTLGQEEEKVARFIIHHLPDCSTCRKVLLLAKRQPKNSKVQQYASEIQGKSSKIIAAAREQEFWNYIFSKDKKGKEGKESDWITKLKEIRDIESAYQRQYKKVEYAIPDLAEKRRDAILSEDKEYWTKQMNALKDEKTKIEEKLAEIKQLKREWFTQCEKRLSSNPKCKRFLLSTSLPK